MSIRADLSCVRSALVRFVVLSSPATNSASPLVSCLPRLSSTLPRTVTTPASTVFPSAIQFPWAIILGTGLLFLPDSPRYFVKKGRLADAADSLARLRGQPKDSDYIQVELAEIVANEEYERALIPDTTWFGSWAHCFSGSLWTGKSNLRRTILGTSMQMMQQW